MDLKSCDLVGKRLLITLAKGVVECDVIKVSPSEKYIFIEEKVGTCSSMNGYWVDITDTPIEIL